MKLLVTLIGLILVLEGLPYVASPEAMHRWLRQILTLRPRQMRIIGLLAMTLGFALCFIAQKTDLFN